MQAPAFLDPAKMRTNLEECRELLASIADDPHAKIALERIEHALTLLPPPEWITEKQGAEAIAIVSWQVFRLLLHGQGLNYQFFGNCMVFPPEELDRIPDDLLKEIWELYDDGAPTKVWKKRANILAERKKKAAANAA
jgi:Uma2 family endonuclease